MSDQEEIVSLKNPQHRKIRYSTLLTKISGIEESGDIGLESIKSIGKVINEINSLNKATNIDERVKQADETILDFKVLSTAGRTLKKCIESVDVYKSTYEPKEFAKKIISFCTDEENEETDIMKLLKFAEEIVVTVPQMNSMFGAVDLEKIPVRQEPKAKKQRKEQYQRKELEKVTDLEKREQDIDEIVKVFNNVLIKCYEENESQPVNYYDYVIDTSSFPKTIENMFYCSFLIRNGKASKSLDSKGNPILSPISKKDLKEARSEGRPNSQIITSFTMNQWKQYNKKGYIQKHIEDNLN